jgi:predicted dehydrogenase
MGQDKKLRVGIAGYGIIGPRRHECIDKHPNMKVVAICDQKFENKFEGEIQYYKYHKDLLEHPLDALIVCMPNDVAPDITIMALERGLHVFCEKPPGRTVGDIKMVRDVEQKHPELKLKYGFNHRYHDSIRDALKIVRNGEFGKLINMRGVYGKSAFIPWPRPTAEKLDRHDPRFWRTNRAAGGGGILLDQGIHMVDLMRLFAGEFAEIKSFVKNSYWNHDVEDNAYAIMQAENGVVAMLHSTATQWRHTFTLEMFLEKGALLLHGILSGSKSYGQETLTVVYREDDDAGNPREQTTSYNKDNSWHDEIFEFGDAIANNRPITVGTSWDAFKTMELVYKVYCADSEWKNKFHLSCD